LAGAALAALVITSLIGLLVPWPLKVLVDHVLGKEPLPAWMVRLVGTPKTIHLLILTVTAGLAIALLHDALRVLNEYLRTLLEQRMVLDVRSDLFEHSQRLSLSFHDQRRSGMVIYAVNFQAEAVPGLLMTIPPLAESAITLGGMLWISMRIDWQLALLSLTVVPVLYYAVGYYTTHIQERLRTVKMMEGESLSIVHEAFSMLRVIVAFGRETHEQKRFRQQGERAVGERVRVTLRQTLFTLAVNLTTATGGALVLGVGAYHAMIGKLTVGQMLVVVAYVTAVYKPLEAISYTVGSLQDRFANLQMAFGLLDTPIEIHDSPNARELGKARGHIQFDDITFSYTGRVDTLRNISFEASPGELVAVVGPTGAGKTTLVSLLPRFYSAVSGRILLDGEDIRDITLRSLRDQISLVLQEPLLFSGTIEDNIRYGRLDAQRDEIIDAARSANAHDFIMSLPKQYETELGERGVQLSGGERQRISVARAFLRDAPVLILDEPTSAIDSKTETVILDSLDRLMVGRTTFMIAHRLSTVRRADKILVMNKGELVGSGTHEQLMQECALYKQLHDLQMGQRRGTRQIVTENEEVTEASIEPADSEGAGWPANV
jgi:ABC-type multidrug transport system fused ATPase/permease subunit